MNRNYVTQPMSLVRSRLSQYSKAVSEAFQNRSENYFGHLIYSIIISLCYTIIYNLAYYSIIYSNTSYSIFSSVINAFFQILPLIYILSFNRKIYSCIFVFIILTSTVMLYYSYKIGVVHNVELLSLIYETNIHEIKGLISRNLVLLTIISLPLTILVCGLTPKAHLLYKKSVATIIIMLSIVPLAYQTLHETSVASKIRDHPLTGNFAMPYGYLQAFIRATRQHIRIKSYLGRRAVYTGRAEAAPHGKPLYIVLALGESQRADHLPVFGYARNTMPKLSREDLYIFPPAFSMYNLTTRSVLGMLTQATIAAPDLFETGPSVLTVFRQAGFRTVWLTNQGSMSSGGSSVRAISEAADYFELSANLYQASAKLVDTDMLPMLDRALDVPEQDTLIVLHTYGSHFNYDDRYHDESRVFTPICAENFLECPLDRLINSYDNSLVSTDAYLAELIRRLRSKNAVLFMTSDHGSVLEENRRGQATGNPGMSYPPSRMVPFMLWFSPEFERRDLVAILEANLDKRVSHDMIFHSLLGAADISAPILEEELNIFSPALRPHQDPYISEETAREYAERRGNGRPAHPALPQ